MIATPSVRVRLLEQRAFRSMQLEELGDPGGGGLTAAGPTEVRRALRVAAQAALSDVEAALRRIDQGTYGRCLRCGDAISPDRLDAVPSAPLCGTCHHAVETTRPQGSPSRRPRRRAAGRGSTRQRSGAR